MTTYRLQYPAGSIGKSRSLRRKMTDAGSKLWSRLRRDQLGVHFRREVPQGPYFCDFLSVEVKLVVEVDGGGHQSLKGRTHDSRRDAYLTAKGLTVMRFTDKEVLINIQGVLQRIYDHIHAQDSPSAETINIQK